MNLTELAYRSLDELARLLCGREVSPLEQPLAIGLPIAREVVQLSGGALTYSPDGGPGPCFLLSLPLWRSS